MKTVLLLAALAEGTTGAALLAVPSIVFRMLFGAEVGDAGEVTGRIAGIALIGLGVTCWPGGSTRPALRGMLTYSLLALLFLAYVGVRGASVGVLLWPAVVVHAILVALLLRDLLKAPGLLAGVNDMSVAGEAQRLRRPLNSVARRGLREPLLHFLLLGAVLFGVYSYFEPRSTGPETSKQISLTPDDLLQLMLVFQSQWQRPPTQAEFGRLVESKVREEVLFREAVAMGLDRDDTIVKRRMAQKMQFLAEDVAAAHEPTTAELEAWYAKNAAKFVLPGRLNFQHVYFSPDRHGARARDDAANALAKLAGHPVDSQLAASLGDPFMLQDYYADRSPDQLARELGPLFAQDVFRVRPGAWQGPVESGFGWHLVFVDSFVPGRAPAFSEVESDVKTAWLGERKAEAWRKAYDAMRAKYTVSLPTIPEAVGSARPSLPLDGGPRQPPEKPAP